MIAKRGVALDMVHFFSYPYTSLEAKEKVLEPVSYTHLTLPTIGAV